MEETTIGAAVPAGEVRPGDGKEMNGTMDRMEAILAASAKGAKK